MVLSQANQDFDEGAVLNIQEELDETERSLKEVTLMIEQSQDEVGKLTQRNAAITAHLQQIQSDIATMPAEEVRMAYDSALDAQQRLLVMRGQLDKLQNDKTHLDRYKAVLKQTNGSATQDNAQVSGGKRSELSNIEMVVNAQEAERQRLSRQMHDGPAQALSNFILQAEIAMRLLSVDVEQAREELNSLKASAMRTFQKVRNFIFELRPMMLDDLGLIPTLRRYADTFREQSGLEISLVVSGTERRLEPYLEVMVFRALQELLGNATRHSHATTIKIYVDVGENSIKVNVDDNGKGFDAELIEQGGSLGLKLIKDRVEMLGGTFAIDSSAGKGTRVSFSAPVVG
ncbi:MAG: sensor histidine kinase [Anaerolineae bacterium]|jgi:two-component system, NarL family, sensor histidine kinase DegS|nr:sensor histidine kinase [Anaerolineae bacterium]MBT7325475.1 sensor histidine kinase [Anaerolineae bacterium]